MKKNTKIFLASLLVLAGAAFVSHSASAATYYFDAVNGNDDTGAPNDINHPYQTIGKLNSLTQTGTIVAGDFIKFRKGTTSGQQMFRGQIHLNHIQGISGSPITFTSYNVNSNETYKPELNSTIIITDHSGAGWTSVGGNIYSYWFGGSTGDLFEDGLQLRQASDATLVDGNWWNDVANARILYRPTSGGPADHFLERGLHGLTIYDQGNNYITIDGLKFTREGLYHNYAYATGAGIAGWTIQNCDFLYHGVAFWQGGGYTWIDLTIQNNTFDYCFGPSIRLEGGAGSSESFTRLKVLNNIVTHNNTNVIDGKMAYPPNSGGDCDCIPIQTMNNSIVSGNDLSGNTTGEAGITYWISALGLSVNNQITNNYIHDVTGAGIRYDGSLNQTTHSIQITDNIIARYAGPEGGIGGAGFQSPSSRSLIANNTLYSGTDGIQILGGNYDIKNNVIVNMSKAYLNLTPGSASNTVDNNLYFDVSSGNHWASPDSYTLKDWTTWRGLGFDANSILADPFFTNASGNFSKASDFQLASGSPVIGAGANVGLTSDYAGNAFANPPSIGAFEYGGSTPPPTYSSADLNQDNLVNTTDLSILKSDFLKLTANLTNPKSDIDGDGQVTVKDVGIMMSEWKP